uniref:Uncharacterized protein n=1 Tax=Tanacetum cinerariifolium TaxID=118510 RepID=A0A6L2LBZ2_TANCI|nr:hypothetical protein [Tanacetum cinerariifolium]
MSSASSAVTYTSVYTDSELGRVFWGADEELSNGGSSRVIDEDEREPMFIQPHDPDYVLEPMYPEYIPLEDEHEDPEEYEEDETEDGPIDHPIDGGDDGDDDDGDSFRDDTDDEDGDEDEEHLAPVDSAVVIPTVELVSPHEGTEPDSIPFPPEAEVERLLAMPTPPPSPLTSLSPPFAGERLARCTAPPAHSPPLIPSPLLPSSWCPTQIQTLRMASTQALIDTVTAALPSPPLPPLPPPIYLPPHVDHRDDIPETKMPPRKKSCLFALGSRYEIGESSTAKLSRGRGIYYGFVGTLDVEARRRGIREFGVTELVKLHKHDTQDLYALLEDAQDSRTRISKRVTMDSQLVDLLMEDRISYQKTILIVEEDAYALREA